MALDLPIPRNVLVHGHWTMNREKMSKSTGNVVNPFFAIDRFGVDTMRFFLSFQGGLASDADYDNAHIIRDYKKYLQQGIGNIAHRTIGCAKKNLRTYIVNAVTGKSPATRTDQEYQKMLEELSTKVAEHMEKLNPRAALQEIMAVIVQVRQIALGKSYAELSSLTLFSLPDKQIFPQLGAVEESRTEPARAVQRRRINAYHGNLTTALYAYQG